jgi:hypothetical protein
VRKNDNGHFKLDPDAKKGRLRDDRKALEAKAEEVARKEHELLEMQKNIAKRLREFQNLEGSKLPVFQTKDRSASPGPSQIASPKAEKASGSWAKLRDRVNLLERRLELALLESGKSTNGGKFEWDPELRSDGEESGELWLG